MLFRSELDLADAAARGEQFRQRSARPASLMERGVERGVSARQPVAWVVGGRGLAGLPDVGPCKECGERIRALFHTVNIYS